MQARRTAGLLHQAERGALALPWPTGLGRTSPGTVQNMPHQAAQARLSLVCDTFLQGRSARTVVAVFQAHQRLLPRRGRCGDLVWTAPRGAAVRAMLKHPASAGAFPSGRPHPLRREASQGRPAITRRPQEPGRVCSPDGSPSSSSGETELQMQARRKDQHAESDRHNTRGLPRPGTALWPGLVSGGAWGHNMVGQSKGGTRSLCPSLRQP